MLIAFAFSLKNFFFCLFVYTDPSTSEVVYTAIVFVFLLENNSVSSSNLSAGALGKSHFNITYYFLPPVFSQAIIEKSIFICLTSFVYFFSFCYYVLFTFQKYLCFMRINSYCCHTFLFYLECP